jgi:glycosyltransferase involved in cell wall biosynthesis
MISLIIPSYNNLKHLKNAYSSIKKHAPSAELVLLDDGSTDGTWEWISKIAESDDKVVKIRWTTRVGHTILYDVGIRESSNEIVGILHADMIIGPNYVENLVKHLKHKTVVCATRIEPPLHPPGKEKIIMDFGQDFDSLDVPRFESYCSTAQSLAKDTTTKGMFAPWVLYKSDFQAIGGHDKLFAPFPYEDSDIFQRWILAGYELIQSRDSFVYHLTCRGHRWNETVGKDDAYYKEVSQKAARNYIRKWGSWIKNDEYQYPIIAPKYNIAFVVKNCNIHVLEALEPWCDKIYVDDLYDYIEKEQKNTLYDMSKRVLPLINSTPFEDNDIVVEIDAKVFNNQSFNIIQQLPNIIKESGDIGRFKLGEDLTVTINKIEELQDTLIKFKPIDK